MEKPVELKVATAKNNIYKFIEVTAMEEKLPPFIIVGILAQSLTEWQRRELIQVNDAFESNKEVNENV